MATSIATRLREHCIVWRAGILAVACLSLSPVGDCAAQSAGLEAVGRFAQEYSDNVFFSATEVADFISTLQAELAAHWTRPRGSLAVSAGNSAEIFARESRNSDAFAEQHLAVSAQWQASPRTTWTLSDRLLRSRRSRFSGAFTLDPGPLPPAGEAPAGGSVSTLLPDGRTLNNDISFSAAHRWTPLWSGQLRLGHVLRDDQQSDGRDQVVSLSATMRRQLLPAWGAQAGYQARRFEFSDAAPNGETHQISAGVDWQVSSAVTARGGAGMALRRDEPGGRGTRLEGTGFVDLLYLREAWVGEIGLSQEVGDSTGIGGVGRATTASARGRWSLGADIAAVLQSVVSRLSTRGQDTWVMALTSSIERDIGRTLGLRLAYEYRRRDGDVSVATERGVVDGHSVIVSLSAALPIWQSSAI